MSEWQPIATAPKDGTRILVWAESPANGRRSVHQVWWRMPYEGAPESAGWWEAELWGGRDHPVVAQFTHGWMPLPSPPKENP